jgi:putative SOS response-associated peptidase YedK
MCGRFTLTTPEIATLAELFAADLDPRAAEDHRPRYNIAPRSVTALLRLQGGRRRIEPGTWGLPAAGEDRRPDGSINARAETVARLPSFRDAYARGRCGVLADGFYEWSGSGAGRRPLWFHPRAGGPLVLAGISRDDEDPETGEVTRRFCILTTRANATLAPHHERMPVIVAPSQLSLWLGGARPAELAPLLRPAPDDLLAATPVSTRVNSPRHDDPACLDPA